jgi:hypothetical protein
MQTIDISVQLPSVAAEDSALVAQAKALQITDDATFVRAGEFLKGIVALRKKITDTFDDPKKKAHEAHKAITKAEKDQLEPVLSAESLVKGRVADYQREQDRKRREEQARLQRIADEEAAARRKADEDARLEAAAKLEAEGKTAEAERVVAQAIAEPVRPAPVIHLPTAAPKVAGVQTKSVWKVEVTDKQALARYIVDNWALLGHMLDINGPALNDMAKRQKEACTLPGVRVFEDQQIAVR